MIVDEAVPLVLTGSPFERGAAQASSRPALRDAVQAAARRRDAGIADAQASEAGRLYLARQFDFAQSHCVAELAELDGIAAGFGLEPRALFDGLHASALSRLAESEGCTAWAAGGANTLLAKNRDIRADLRPLQDVMLHVDPSHPMRVVLCVGSVGAPGAYSSGINRAGLAVADTAIRADRHGTGWLRYFAMTRLLWACADVGEALGFLRSRPHSGGGSLVLADRAGSVAAVEFTSAAPAVEVSRVVSRTNHFVTPGATTAFTADDPDGSNSMARLAALRACLAAEDAPASIASAAALMAMHGSAALCRHGDGDATRTVSSAVFATRTRELYFAPDYPCLGRWRRYALAAYDG